MKKTITFLLLLIIGLFELRAQVVLYENFSAPFNPATNGWELVNLSSPTGTNVNGWHQGLNTQFNAIVGNSTDYFAADMYATSSSGTTNTISCWLISPTLTLQNGAWLQFASRCNSALLNKADRLQVYYSIGTGTNVGTGVGTATNSAGTFTNLLLDINPNMTTNYPVNWWAYTSSITGVPAPTVGRIAFRYYVPNGGAAGPNGHYIGLDEIRYALPCNRPEFFGDPVAGATVCVGQPATFMIYQANPNNPVTSYTWANGATTSTTSIVPTATGVVALATLGESTPGCQALDISYYFPLVPPTVTYTINPSNQVCAGASVTVTASGANTYTYFLGQQSSNINPIVLTAHATTATAVSQFTVAGKATNGCISRETVSVQVNPLPTLTATATKTTICLNGTVGLNATGAASYSWSGAISSTLGAFTYTGSTVGVKQFTVCGISSLGCKSANSLITINVSACTGLEEESDELLVSAFPNPFHEEIQISGFQGDLKLYDVNGKLVKELRVLEGDRVSTTELPMGIYLGVFGLENGKLRILKLVKE